MTPDTLLALERARAEKRPVVLATRMPGGEQVLLPAGHPLDGEAERALAAEKSRTVQWDGADWFLHAFAQPARLVVVGAVHVAQALAPLAVQLGFAVTVVDPRRSFASAERFPGVALRTDWPDEALDALGPDRGTAIVTLTHDPKIDDPALDRALRSDAFYIGALGSRKTAAGRVERLRALGHTEAAIGRIHGPVGLAIGAVTAPEIALSVIAQLVSVRRGGRVQ